MLEEKDELEVAALDTELILFFFLLFRNYICRWPFSSFATLFSSLLYKTKISINLG